MDLKFKDKRVLVTGAGRGIGRGVVERLCKYGAQVIALSKTKENLDTLKQQFPQVDTICVDVSDWNATKKEIANIGHVDCLVNNAGIFKETKIGSTTEEDFDLIFNINVKSIVNITQELSKGMIANGKGGTIVNISSQDSLAAMIDHLIYGASKAAVDQLTREFAAELGPHKIRVNSVNPTVVLTDMAKIGWSDETRANELKSKIPLRKFAEVENIVDTIVYLLSDSSDMITGIIMPIDGGYTAC